MPTDAGYVCFLGYFGSPVSGSSGPGLSHLRPWPRSTVGLDAGFRPIRVRTLTVKMPFSEFGVGHEATRVHRAYCTRGDGMAVRSARAAARSSAPPWRANGKSIKRPCGKGARGRLGA